MFFLLCLDGVKQLYCDSLIIWKDKCRTTKHKLALNKDPDCAISKDSELCDIVKCHILIVEKKIQFYDS